MQIFIPSAPQWLNSLRFLSAGARNKALAGCRVFHFGGAMVFYWLMAQLLWSPIAASGLRQLTKS
jgi:hypothetical protein